MRFVFACLQTRPGLRKTFPCHGRLYDYVILRIGNSGSPRGSVKHRMKRPPWLKPEGGCQLAPTVHAQCVSGYIRLSSRALTNGSRPRGFCAAHRAWLRVGSSKCPFCLQMFGQQMVLPGPNNGIRRMLSPARPLTKPTLIGRRGRGQTMSMREVLTQPRISTSTSHRSRLHTASQ